jgi:putative zinc finger/helix-turn-helix YgiT family protein
MAIATIPYRTLVEHDGRQYSVYLPALSTPKCSNCGAISIDDEADRQVDEAFRHAAGLLTPERIREGRQQLGMTQQELADAIDVAVSTLSRWETGTQIQQRAMNKLLRAFFELPEFRMFCRERNEEGLLTGDETETGNLKERSPSEAGNQAVQPS